MNDYDPRPTVTVPASPIGAQASSAVRDVLKILGTLLVSKGVIESSWVEPLVGAVMVLGPIMWSQLSVLRKHTRMIIMANELPDDVVQIK